MAFTHQGNHTGTAATNDTEALLDSTFTTQASSFLVMGCNVAGSDTTTGGQDVSQSPTDTWNEIATRFTESVGQACYWFTYPSATLIDPQIDFAAPHGSYNSYLGLQEFTYGTEPTAVDDLDTFGQDNSGGDKTSPSITLSDTGLAWGQARMGTTSGSGCTTAGFTNYQPGGNVFYQAWDVDHASGAFDMTWDGSPSPNQDHSGTIACFVEAAAADELAAMGVILNYG